MVIAAEHHADINAHQVGKPHGTFALALLVTVSEVGLIITWMAGTPVEAATLARDTVIAAVMIILNDIIGICLLISGLCHRDQSFLGLDGKGTVLLLLSQLGAAISLSSGHITFLQGAVIW